MMCILCLPLLIIVGILFAYCCLFVLKGKHQEHPRGWYRAAAVICQEASRTTQPLMRKVLVLYIQAYLHLIVILLNFEMVQVFSPLYM